MLLLRTRNGLARTLLLRFAQKDYPPVHACRTEVVGFWEETVTLHPSTIDLRAVLFDRDGTLTVDSPYSGDPSSDRAMPCALEVPTRLRSHGIATGVASNQSGIARGLISRNQYGVPLVKFGDQQTKCGDTRARVYRVPSRPGLSRVGAQNGVEAVSRLTWAQHDSNKEVLESTTGAMV